MSQNLSGLSCFQPSFCSGCHPEKIQVEFYPIFFRVAKAPIFSKLKIGCRLKGQLLILYSTGNIASLHTQKRQKNSTKQNNNTKSETQSQAKKQTKKHGHVKNEKLNQRSNSETKFLQLDKAFLGTPSACSFLALSLFRSFLTQKKQKKQYEKDK